MRRLILAALTLMGSKSVGIGQTQKFKPSDFCEWTIGAGYQASFPQCVIAVGRYAGFNFHSGDHMIFLGDASGSHVEGGYYELWIGSQHWKMTHEQWANLYDALMPIVTKRQEGQ